MEDDSTEPTQMTFDDLIKKLGTYTAPNRVFISPAQLEIARRILEESPLVLTGKQIMEPKDGKE